MHGETVKIAILYILIVMFSKRRPEHGRRRNKPDINFSVNFDMKH